jgi:tetratricopeptide (TPR) repeat protein
MSRWQIAPFLLGASLVLSAQQPPQPLPPDEDAPARKAPAAPQALPPDEDSPKQAGGAKPAAADSDLPPDEDAANSAQETYVFNPVKAKKDIEVGDQYFKKGDYKAAVLRYRDATKWNEGSAPAWLALGKAEEKRGQVNAARAAYEKYLQLAGNAKGAVEVQKKLEKLK